MSALVSSRTGVFPTSLCPACLLPFGAAVSLVVVKEADPVILSP